MASDREVAAHFRLVVKCRAIERRDDAALVHHVAALRHGADHVEVLLDDDDRHVGLAIEIDDGAGDVLHDRRLNALRRFVEQNLDMIRAMAQRCYVMDKGRIVAELTPAMLDDSEVVRRYLAV